jgi:hypothetical protein
MRIDRPRATTTFVDKAGKTRHRVYFAQYLMLRLMDVVGSGEPVPREVNGIPLITATGMLRKHLAGDLVFAHLAEAKPDHGTGQTDCVLSPAGRRAIRDKDTEVVLPKDRDQRREFAEKMQAIDLLARQRKRAHVAKAHVRPVERRSKAAA